MLKQMICEAKGCNKIAYFKENIAGVFEEAQIVNFCENCILLFRHPYEINPELESNEKEINKTTDMEFKQIKEKTNKKFNNDVSDGIIEE